MEIFDAENKSNTTLHLSGSKSSADRFMHCLHQQIQIGKDGWPGISKRNRYVLLIVLIQLTTGTKLVSQYEKRWLGNFQVGDIQRSILDKTYSSLSYRGNTFYGSAVLQYTGLKAQHALAFFATSANLSSTASDQVHVRYINIDYTNLYRLCNVGNHQFINKAGLGINILSDNRIYKGFINNNHTNDFAASLSAVVQTDFFFKNRLLGFSISNRIQLPVISGVRQPVYGADSYDVPSGADSRIKSVAHTIRYLSFPAFVRVKDEFQIKKDIGNVHELSCVYIIDYYKIDNSRVVKQINQRFGIAYGYKF